MKNTFITQYKPYALQTELKTGISHLFILAQAALESGWGKYAPGNMFFGIKADKNTPLSKKQLLITTEVLPTDKATFPQIISIVKRPDGKFLYTVKDWFRKYDSPEESFTHHALFFLNNKRYAKALLVKTNPYKFADEIAKAGYATDPLYAQKIKNIINKISNE